MTVRVGAAALTLLMASGCALLPSDPGTPELGMEILDAGRFTAYLPTCDSSPIVAINVSNRGAVVWEAEVRDQFARVVQVPADVSQVRGELPTIGEHMVEIETEYSFYAAEWNPETADFSRGPVLAGEEVAPSTFADPALCD
ncbi:hypothetical protein GCM10028777_13040 [Angustibacter speluncae]